MQILLFKFHHFVKFRGQKQAKYESQVPEFLSDACITKYWKTLGVGFFLNSFGIFSTSVSLTESVVILNNEGKKHLFVPYKWVDYLIMLPTFF